LDVALRTPSVLSFKSTVGVEPGFPTAWLNNSTSCLTERPLNKCIGDDTKAAARQSPNCIKRNPKKYGKKTIFNVADGIITPCNVAGGSGMTCHGIRQDVRRIGWNSTSGFDFDHITAVDM